MTVLLDFLFHWDHYLQVIVLTHKEWIYPLLFLIIFCETGLVLTPFLPGDSLVFTLGIFAAKGWLNLYSLFFLLTLAAIGGDSLNYLLGNKFGKLFYAYSESFFIKKEHILKKTEDFFSKYGAKAIFLSRFVPILRTFTPFIAGIGSMAYSRFLFFNVFGGLCWIGLFLGTGYFLGNQPLIKNHFKTFIYLIIFFSLFPLIIERIKSKLTTKTNLAVENFSKKRKADNMKME